eukprot:977251-Rhodomonas_salina.5
MGKSKRVGFDEESEKRRREAISSLTDEISGLFKRCETNIKVRSLVVVFRLSGQVHRVEILGFRVEGLRDEG